MGGRGEGEKATRRRFEGDEGRQLRGEDEGYRVVLIVLELGQTVSSRLTKPDPLIGGPLINEPGRSIKDFKHKPVHSFVITVSKCHRHVKLP